MNGRKTPWEYVVKKYGHTGAVEICRANFMKASRAGGLANKGVKKSEEHKKRLRASMSGTSLKMPPQNIFWVEFRELGAKKMAHQYSVGLRTIYNWARVLKANNNSQ